tara:strand:- start:534 stop:2180 length:1647 start_codon:yes stop_codon:yes gene_type:complete
MKKLQNLKEKIELVLQENGFNEDIEFRISNIKKYDLQINNIVKYQEHKKINLITSELKNVLNKNDDILNFEITENCFINLELNIENFIVYFRNIENNIKVDRSEKIIFDYGGPNIGKPLHVGHLRSLNIGRSLYNINKIAGNTVVSDIHLGDWGMPIAQILNFCELNNLDVSKISISKLEEIYPKASKLYINDPDFQSACKELNKDLNENNNKSLLKKWKNIKDTSLHSIKSILEELDHSFDHWLGESDVNHLIPQLISNLEKNNKVSLDEGAYISNEETEPKILITKSDGSYLYLTTDLATVLNRIKNEGFDKTIYIVDKRQQLHFKQLFSSLKYFDFEDKEYEHVDFGTVNDKNGNPFKTRDGGTKQLKDLFDETCEYISKINQDLDSGSIKILGNTVLTYSDLITNRKTDYKFDLEKFTNITGKTGIYVQYSLVRAKKLVSAFTNEFENESINLINLQNEEKALLKSFSKFESYFKHSLTSNEPHHLADYLYELSSLFNSMYQKENILSEQEDDIKRRKIYITFLFIQYSTLLMKSLGINQVKKM